MFRSLMCVILLAGIATTCFAGLTPTFNVWSLLARSDVVWCGEIRQIALAESGTLGTKEHPIPVKWIRAHMAIDLPIKGDRPVGLGEFHFPVSVENRTLFSWVLPGQRVMVFLVKTEGMLTYTDPANGRFIMSWQSGGVADQTVSPEEKMARELVQGLGSQQPWVVSDVLQQLLTSQDTPAADHVAAISVPAVQRLTTSADPQVVGLGLAALIALRQGSALPQALDLLLKPPNPGLERAQERILISLEALPTSQLHALSEAYKTSQGHEIAEFLNPLLNHPVAMIRLRTANVLGSLASPSSVAWLIKALDDPSPDVSARAIVALDKIVGKGGEWCPPVISTPEAKDKAVQLWKAWWAQKGKAQYTAPNAK